MSVINCDGKTLLGAMDAFGTMLVTQGKTPSARRVLPMTPRVRATLETRWQRVGKPLNGWVWLAPSQSGHIDHCNLKKRHIKAVNVAKLHPFVLYSLRHTFLTRLGESGCDAWTLARIAGHSSIAISSRYVHPFRRCRSSNNVSPRWAQF